MTLAEDLMTLAEWATLNEWNDLFTSTNSIYDDTTRNLLFEFFKYRQVEDNERFADYFKRSLMLLAKQWEEYKRLESISIDPFVSHYLESRTQTDNSETNNTQTDTTTTADSSDVIAYERHATNNSDGTTNGDLRSETTQNGRTTNNSNTESNSDSNTIGNRVTDNSKDTDTTSNTDKNIISDNNTNTDDAGGSMSLSGATPESAYMVDATGVYKFPENLHWQYASGQAESKDYRNTEAITHSTEDETEKVESNISEKGLINEDSSEQNDSHSLTTHDATTENNNNDVRVDDSSVTSNIADETNIKDDTTKTSNTEEIKNINVDSINTQKGDTRRIETGRNVLPQVALEQYKAYILTTNGWLWLVDKLESCFSKIFIDF